MQNQNQLFNPSSLLPLRALRDCQELLLSLVPSFRPESVEYRILHRSVYRILYLRQALFPQAVLPHDLELESRLRTFLASGPPVSLGSD